MPVIDIPEVGHVEFPADMSDEQIETAIKEKILPAEGLVAPEEAARRLGLPGADRLRADEPVGTEALTTPFARIPRPQAEADDSGITSFGKGLAEAGVELAEGLETPLGVGILGATLLPGGVGKVVGRAAAAGFGVATTLSGFQEAAKAYQEGDPKRAGLAVGRLLMGGAMVRGSVAAPRTTQALAESASVIDQGSTIEIAKLDPAGPVYFHGTTGDLTGSPGLAKAGLTSGFQNEPAFWLSATSEGAQGFAEMAVMDRGGQPKVHQFGMAAKNPLTVEVSVADITGDFQKIKADSIAKAVKDGNDAVIFKGPSTLADEIAVLDPAILRPLAERTSTASASPLGITPQPPTLLQAAAERIATEVQGRALIDESRIRTAIAQEDVLPGRDYITSPEFEFRKNPEASALATRLNEQELSYKHDVSADRAKFEALADELTTGEQKGLTEALKAAEAGNPALLDALRPEARAAATEIRNFYDQIRDIVRSEKAESIRTSLTEPQQRALSRLEAGETFDNATSNLSSHASVEAVRASFDELAEASRWGIDNYTTHIERGSFRVTTENGGTVAIGRTRAEAALKADAWLREHPNVRSLILDDDFSPGTEFPTKLGKGQYWRLISRLEEATQQDAGAIQALLHAQGSIVSIKPTLKYAAPLQQRRNVLKGEENVFDVLPLYSHAMRKKLALDPVLREARDILPRLPENMREQMEALLADVKGRKTVSEKLVDAVLSPLGLEPFTLSRSVNTLKQASAILKLGYRPVAAFVNRVGGAQHTWVKAGSKWMGEGRKFLKTDEGKALLNENKPYIGMEASFTEAASEVGLAHPLGMFQLAERINRPEAFASFYKMAREGFGLEHEAAVAYARKTTRFTQFTYNMASLPRAMRGPTGRLALQFKPYLVKELEFISSLRGAEIPRYLTGFLLLGGPRAALITLRSLPILGAIGLLANLEDFLNRELPVASRGLPGLAGADISASVAFQFPEETRDWLGPTLSDFYRLWNDILKPAMQGESRDLSDVRNWAKRLAPILSSWGQLAQTFTGDEEVRDWKGRVDVPPSQLDRVKLALGVKPLDKAVQEVETRFLLESEGIAQRNRARMLKDYAEAASKGDEIEMERLLNVMAEAGISNSTIKRSLAEKQLDPHERVLRRLPKLREAQERERRE